MSFHIQNENNNISLLSSPRLEFQRELDDTILDYTGDCTSTAFYGRLWLKVRLARPITSYSLSLSTQYQLHNA